MVTAPAWFKDTAAPTAEMERHLRGRGPHPVTGGPGRCRPCPARAVVAIRPPF
ncbi:hypothetical protein OG700_02165 [Streptomyces sp. NBC_01508]